MGGRGLHGEMCTSVTLERRHTCPASSRLAWDHAPCMQSLKTIHATMQKLWPKMPRPLGMLRLGLNPEMLGWSP